MYERDGGRFTRDVQDIEMHGGRYRCVIKMHINRTSPDAREVESDLQDVARGAM